VWYGLLVLHATATLHADEPQTSWPDSLLRRFDADGNGKLDGTERRALRKAFGGIDVPVLPAVPLKYTTVRLPAHVKSSQLTEIDSTPRDSPLTDAGAALGRVLFYDTQLSRNDTVSCASCHLQSRAFSDPRKSSVGFAGGKTGRNAMNLANLRYSNLQGHRPGFFWDERAATLEAQVLMPIQDEVEMGMTLPQLEKRIARLPWYPPLFKTAFGSSQVTSRHISQAVAQFMRAMVSFNAKFDRAAPASGDYSKAFPGFTDQENLGRSLFFDGTDGIAEHGCAHCHIPPTFGMTKAQNNGLALKYADAGLGKLKRRPNDPFTPSDDGKFKAASLRNIELTAPYMHDGRFKTLAQVVNHYSQGVHPHVNLGLAFGEDNDDFKTQGFQFNTKQQAALVAFLKTLTDHTFVKDVRFSDPFIRAPFVKKRAP
jgi:cytochrome c peroxidase